MNTMQTNQFQKLDFEIVQARDGNSMYLDISLPSFMARATIGSLDRGRGYCDTEILNAETSENIQWQHQEFSSSQELNSILTDFFQKLHDLPADDIPAVSFKLPLSDKNVSLDAFLEPLLSVAAGR